jgi:8-oxo-dGTP diphosphatase
MVFGEPRGFPSAVERRAAYAVVRDAAGRVLSVRTERALFLPGGGIEEGEEAEEALRREVKEELGRALASCLHRASAVQHFVAAGVPYRMTADFFLATLGERLEGTPEHSAHWVDDAREECWYHESHRWAAGTLR